MTRRSLFLTIAAALVVAGIGALDARAGSVALPQPYSTLLIPGTYTTVVGAETLTFSSFTYASSTGILPSTVTTLPYTVGPETGLQFSTGLLYAAQARSRI